ncbi:uroporphyrinogen decarboxylase/cobalamine-independent methonine synthase family protein [Arthrobacter sp. TMN-37]
MAPEPSAQAPAGASAGNPAEAPSGGPAGDPAAQVTATAPGEWPGTDPLEAHRAVRGELGGPHLPFLASLPQRGPGSDAVGRTLGMLVELPFDLQPHGWRLVARPGKDQRRAESALSSDLNALGDVAGAEEVPAERVKVHLRGPLSVAANVHLHSGERALLDAGARREIYASLAAGAADLVRRTAAVARGAAVEVQLDEPEVDAVLAGRIPTASGYRTLRAVPRQEAADAWAGLHAAVRDAGAHRLVLRVPGGDAVLEAALSSPAETLGLPFGALTDAQWERLAEAVESGRRLWAEVLAPGNTVPQVSALVAAVSRPWQRVGLPPARLGAVTVAPSDGLAGLTPAAARQTLARLVAAADALNQLAADD